MINKRKALIVLISAALITLTGCAKQQTKVQKLDPYDLDPIVELIDNEVTEMDPDLSREDYFLLYQAANEAFINCEEENEECQLDKKNLVKETDDWYYQDF